MIPLNTVFPPLVEHPHRGAWLRTFRDAQRTAPLERHIQLLKRCLDVGHPDIGLAESWHAVGQGSEVFEDRTLATLKRTEPVIRQHFPNARRALALNLATQGCHTWFLHTKKQAIGPLSEAFEMMMDSQLVCEADIIKVAEVLADCQSGVGRFDEALCTLARAFPLYLAAREQAPWLAAQYDEFRHQFVEDMSAECSEELQYLVEALRGPRVPTWDIKP